MSRCARYRPGLRMARMCSFSSTAAAKSRTPCVFRTALERDGGRGSLRHSSESERREETDAGAIGSIRSDFADRLINRIVNRVSVNSPLGTIRIFLEDIADDREPLSRLAP